MSRLPGFVRDEEKLCRPCQQLGRTVKAHRILPGGGGRCDEHFRQELGLPPITNLKHFGAAAFTVAEKGTLMSRGKKLDAEKEAAIRKDLAEGMSVEATRKKHGVGWITVKKLQNGKSTAPRLRAAPLGRAILLSPKTQRKSAPLPLRDGFDGFDGMLKELVARRDALDRAIAAVKELV